MAQDPSGMNEPSARSRRTVIAWSFVAVQAALLIAFATTPRRGDWVLTSAVDIAAVAVIAVGLGVGLWAALKLGRGLTPSPLPNGAVGLVTRGPYRWVRHPMYTAVMMIAAGVAIRSGSVVVIAEGLALVVLFNIKARWEEQRLIEAFPAYRDYRASTSRFVPTTLHGTRAGGDRV